MLKQLKKSIIHRGSKLSLILSREFKKLLIKNVRSSINEAMVSYHSYAKDLEFKQPYVFSSGLCREQHFYMPLYFFWVNLFKQAPKLHRKQWEFVYICQALYERGMLKNDKLGLGFGVGKEPLVSLFASYGIHITATDLDLNEAKQLGWVHSNQHSNSLNDLNELKICDEKRFLELVKFMNVDMNHIPKSLEGFDFCWSSCAFEHLGSIELGLDFVMNSIKTLKPGGIAIHTTEFNLTSNEETLDNNPSFVIFRKQDIDRLVDAIEKSGHIVEKVNYAAGHDSLENYVDFPPYLDEPHLRLKLAGKYQSTSIGLIIHKSKKLNN